MIRLSTIHRRLTTSRRGRHVAAASCALAFAAGFGGRSHASKITPSKPVPASTITHSAPPPQHVLATDPGKSLRLQGVKVKSQIENGRLVVSGFSGSLGGGRINAAGRVDPTNKAARQNIKAQFDDVNLQEVFHLLGVNVASTGMSPVAADGAVDLQWRGMEPGSVRDSITGSAIIKSGAGTISKGSPLVKRLGEAAGIKDLGDLSFHSIRIEATARNGVAHIKSLVLQGSEFRLAAAGTVGIRTDEINLAMDVDVVEALAKRSSYYKLQSVASLLGRAKQETTADGFVEIPRITLAGSMQKLEVQMDQDARGRAAAARAGKSDAATLHKATIKPDPLPEAINSPREVAHQSASTSEQHVPFWRDLLSGLSEASENEQPSPRR